MYDLKWSPRPVFQSYVVYSNELDDINTGHFSGEDMPDKILYKIYNYENKYQFFDEPAVLREILKNYRFTDIDEIDGWGLLEKKEDKSIFEKEFISKNTFRIGEEILVPDINDGYLSYLESSGEN